MGYGKARGGSGTKVKVKAGGKAKKGKAEGMALD